MLVQFVSTVDRTANDQRRNSEANYKSTSKNHSGSHQEAHSHSFCDTSILMALGLHSWASKHVVKIKVVRRISKSDCKYWFGMQKGNTEDVLPTAEPAELEATVTACHVIAAFRF